MTTHYNSGNSVWLNHSTCRVSRFLSNMNQVRAQSSAICSTKRSKLIAIDGIYQPSSTANRFESTDKVQYQLWDFLFFIFRTPPKIKPNRWMIKWIGEAKRNDWDCRNFLMEMLDRGRVPAPTPLAALHLIQRTLKRNQKGTNLDQRSHPKAEKVEN